jgi:hypothetical protein
LQLDESDNLLENLEDALIQADFGPGSSLKIVDEIRTRVESGELRTSDDIKTALKQAIRNLLEKHCGNGKGELQLVEEKPNVFMVVRSWTNGDVWRAEVGTLTGLDSVLAPPPRRWSHRSSLASSIWMDDECEPWSWSSFNEGGDQEEGQVHPTEARRRYYSAH